MNIVFFFHGFSWFFFRANSKNFSVCPEALQTCQFFFLRSFEGRSPLPSRLMMHIINNFLIIDQTAFTSFWLMLRMLITICPLPWPCFIVTYNLLLMTGYHSPRRSFVVCFIVTRAVIWNLFSLFENFVKLIIGRLYDFTEKATIHV